MSFTLGTSVLCLVSFTNGFGGDSSGFDGNWTLNINSTGAKRVISYNGYTSIGQDFTYKWTTYNSSQTYIGLLGSRLKLLMYDGTYWQLVNATLSRVYSDYSD